LLVLCLTTDDSKGNITQKMNLGFRVEVRKGMAGKINITYEAGD
jgi:hypothetical protein